MNVIGWSLRFFPTPGKSQIVSIPCFDNCRESPIPEFNKSFGDSMAPAEIITSSEYISKDFESEIISTPIALFLSVIIFFYITVWLYI